MHNARSQPSTLDAVFQRQWGKQLRRTRQEATIEFRGCDEQASDDVGS